MMYATHVVREEKGREVCRRLDYGFCRVRLPDHPDVPLWLVVVRGLGARPMMLLTNFPMRRSHKSCGGPYRPILAIGASRRRSTSSGRATSWRT